MRIFRKRRDGVVLIIFSSESDLRNIEERIFYVLNGVRPGCGLYDAIIALTKYEIPKEMAECIAWVEKITPGEIVLRRVLEDVFQKGESVVRIHTDNIKPEEVGAFIFGKIKKRKA